MNIFQKSSAGKSGRADFRLANAIDKKLPLHKLPEQPGCKTNG
jgi:hypothetical protein